MASAAPRIACGVCVAGALFAATPALADGFDEALELCPQERITCVSSYDATPGRFVEPWEYDGDRIDAVRRVAAVAARLGGEVGPEDATQRGTALRVRFPAKDGAAKDVAIFWFPVDDALVQFRSERVDGALWDGAANKMRIDSMRRALGYAPAPMVRNRFYLPGERRADGTIQLQEERPYKRADGRFYGNQGGSEGTARGDASGLTSVNSAEAIKRLIFPFGQLGGRSSPAQALYDDITDLANVRSDASASTDDSVAGKLYGR